MTDRFPACLAFTWHPDLDGQPLHVTPGDSGGATAWGVTIGTYGAWRAAHGLKTTTQHDLAVATKDDLSELIRAWFWNSVRGASLPPGVDLMVYDFGFGAGPGTSARKLQQVLGVAQDGDIGPLTLGTIQQIGPALISKLSVAYLSHYKQMAGWKNFGNGWARRNSERLALALEMAG